jgi:hypothetical protein
MGRRKASVAADPLLAAIIAKLPAASSGWPVEQRKAWLHMMEMAFDVVYGPSDAKAAPVSIDPPRTAVGVAMGVAHAGFDYYVDPEGEVLNAIDNSNVLPSDVGDEMIYDYRRGPARDRATVIWADGSIGASPGMNFCGPG